MTSVERRQASFARRTAKTWCVTYLKLLFLASARENEGQVRGQQCCKGTTSGHDTDLSWFCALTSTRVKEQTAQTQDKTQVWTHSYCICGFFSFCGGSSSRQRWLWSLPQQWSPAPLPLLQQWPRQEREFLQLEEEIKYYFGHNFHINCSISAMHWS